MDQTGTRLLKPGAPQVKQIKRNQEGAGDMPQVKEKIQLLNPNSLVETTPHYLFSVIGKSKGRKSGCGESQAIRLHFPQDRLDTLATPPNGLGSVGSIRQIPHLITRVDKPGSKFF